MRRLTLAAVSALLLAIMPGCVSAPTQAEFEAADFGPYPEDSREIIEAYMRARLKDPNNAQYEWGHAPQRAYYRLGGLTYGCVICVRVNARNSFGGYTGPKVYYFLIRDGRIAESLGRDGDYNQALARGACEKAWQ